MTNKLRRFLRKSRKPYLRVLAQDSVYKKFRESDNFAGLPQAQVLIDEGNPVSAPDRLPGKAHLDRPSEDIPV